jgi:hypothetical protein
MMDKETISKELWLLLGKERRTGFSTLYIIVTYHRDSSCCLQTVSWDGDLLEDEISLETKNMDLNLLVLVIIMTLEW